MVQARSDSAPADANGADGLALYVMLLSDPAWQTAVRQRYEMCSQRTYYGRSGAERQDGPFVWHKTHYTLTFTDCLLDMLCGFSDMCDGRIRARPFEDIRAIQARVMQRLATNAPQTRELCIVGTEWDLESMDGSTGPVSVILAGAPINQSFVSPPHALTTGA